MAQDWPLLGERNAKLFSGFGEFGIDDCNLGWKVGSMGGRGFCAEEVSSPLRNSSPKKSKNFLSVHHDLITLGTQLMVRE